MASVVGVAEKGGIVKKTWGPFTGRQLTVMFCALMAAFVLVPSTVYAVDAFSNVAIQDPTSGDKAKVTPANALKVDGTLTARESSPKDLVSFIGNGSGSTCQTVGAPPAGRAWVIKSLSANIFSNGGTPFGPSQFLGVYTNTTCSYPYAWVMTPTSLGHNEVSLDPGLAIPETGALSVQLFGNTTLQWELQARGYSVASSALPGPLSSSSATKASGTSPDP